MDTFRDTTLRLAVQALMLVRRGKKSVETLVSQVREMQDRLAQMERAYSTAQAEVQGTVLFGQYRARVLFGQYRARVLFGQYRV